MREVQDHGAPVDEGVLNAFSTCVQCRGCEPACPSGVPYGHMMEAARETLANAGEMTPGWQRLAMLPLKNPRLLNAGTRALAVAQKLHVVPDRLGLSQEIPLTQPALEATGNDVYLFTGCVMDTMQRSVHEAGLRVLTAMGFGVMPTGDAAPCCGALQAHAGLTDDTRSLAEKMMRNLDPEVPIIVDSAGCGAAMKDYGHLLGTEQAASFSERVFDISEFIALHIDRLPDADPLPLRVAVQDPCHLRHVQRVHLASRTVLRPYVDALVELDDDGLCCGAGGAYSIFEPELAGQIRDRKVASIGRAAPDVVASANPGCSMHLAGVGVPTRHPIALIAEALHLGGA